jgi:hypothetical protein
MAGSNGGRETITLSSDDLGTPIELRPNTEYRLVLKEEPAPIANLNLVVTNYLDKAPLEDLEYQLEGCGRTFTGRTRKGGTISHSQVPAGYYRLGIAGRRYSVPTDPAPGRFHLLYVVADAPFKRHLPEDDETEMQGLSEDEVSASLDSLDADADEVA